MKKLWTCLLGIALTAGVSMGQFSLSLQFNGAVDGTWEEVGNWQLAGLGGAAEALPGPDDYVFKSNPSVTCTVSSSNTVRNLRINEGGPGLVTLHMQDAWLTLIENQWASVAYNVVNGPSTLTMTNSTILHIADTNGPYAGSGNYNGHFNVGYNTLNTSTLIMDNSSIILERGTFRMLPGYYLSDPDPAMQLVVESYFDQDLNTLYNTNTVTMNNGSVIKTLGFHNMDNGLIFINSGSYIQGTHADITMPNSAFHPLSLAQLDQLVANGWIIVNGTPVSSANRNQYIYTNYTTTNIYIGDIYRTVPDVVGQAEATARTSITGAGMQVGTVTSNYSAEVAAGNVISQTPDGGSSSFFELVVPVDFVVSLGPDSPASPYSSIWTGGVTYGDAGTAPTEDYDSDGTVNLYEYALNGNMQGEIPAATEPVFVRGDGETFVYTVVQRTNDVDVVYSVQTRADLLSGDWADTAFDVLSTTPLTGDFAEVQYSIPAAMNQFVRLKITMPNP